MAPVRKYGKRSVKLPLLPTSPIKDSELSQIVYIDRDLEEGAIDLFWRYQDKKWGIVDCTSIMLMERQRCTVAFGYDRHFVEATRQHGFTLL